MTTSASNEHPVIYIPPRTDSPLETLTVRAANDLKPEYPTSEWIAETIARPSRIVVAELADLAPSLRQLYQTIREILDTGSVIEIEGAALFITPTERDNLFMTHLLLLAEFERSIASKGSLARTTFSGGPRRKYDHLQPTVRELRDSGNSLRAIAKEVDVSLGTVQRLLYEYAAAQESDK